MKKPSDAKSSKKKDPMDIHSPRQYSKSLTKKLPFEERSDEKWTFIDKTKVMCPVLKINDDVSVTSQDFFGVKGK